MNSHVMRVLIVGCGNIGGRFDQNRSPGDSPLTHAGAFSRDDRFELAACVEPDDNRRAEFMKVWGVEDGFRSISELADLEERFDVISVCSPTINHAKDLEDALCLRPKLVFCEKPVTSSLPESEALVAKCRAAKIPLAVNYTRRWDTDISKLAMDINTGRWGQLRSIIGTYNKGILNNGSHMLDLLILLAGPIEVIKVGKPVEDYYSDDPSVPVWLEGRQSLPIYLICGHAADYAFFEIQFVFSQGVLTMEDGGMHWRERRAVDSDTFKGYRNLDAGVRHAGKYPHAMLQAVDNIYRSISNGEALASTGESALAAQRLCAQIKQLANGEFPA